VKRYHYILSHQRLHHHAFPTRRSSDLAFEESIAINGKLIKISFSMGVSRFPQDGKDADTLLARADTALYATKNKVRNGHAFFKRSEEHTSELQSRFDLVCRLLLDKKIA